MTLLPAKPAEKKPDIPVRVFAPGRYRQVSADELSRYTQEGWKLVEIRETEGVDIEYRQERFQDKSTGYSEYENKRFETPYRRPVYILQADENWAERFEECEGFRQKALTEAQNARGEFYSFKRAIEDGEKALKTAEAEAERLKALFNDEFEKRVSVEGDLEGMEDAREALASELSRARKYFGEREWAKIPAETSGE